MKSHYLLRNFLARNSSHWLPVFTRPLRMKKLLAFALPFLCTASVFAADVAYTKPVGGFKISAAATTDTRISPVFSRDAAWVGTIANATATTLTAAGTPNWTVSAFVPGASTYYVRLLSGALRGQYFIVTGSTTDTLTVDNAGMNLTTVAPGDAFEVVPFWTLGTLFPASQAGSAFIASSSALARQTEVLTYDANQVGINRASSGTYYFLNGAWRKVGSSASTSFDSTLIFPDSYVVQRNKSAATSLVQTGRVQPAYLGSVIEATTSVQNDNFVSIAFPIDVTLDQAGLVGTVFAASSSPLAVSDQLLWYDPAATGINLASAATYYYYNGAWRKRGSSASLNFGSTVLKAGSGFIIRKAANGSSGSWNFATGI